MNVFLLRIRELIASAPVKRHVLPIVMAFIETLEIFCNANGGDRSIATVGTPDGS